MPLTENDMGKPIRAFVEEADVELFGDGILDCITMWPENSKGEHDVEFVPYSEVLKERERCIEAFRCFEYDYAVDFIRSNSIIVDRK